jgi:large subunit ribosomal protein L7Ae
MGKDSKSGKKSAAKKLPPAPLGPAGGAATKVKKSSVFEKTPRSFRIGGDIQPKRNLTRFVKWPQYIRLQRQKRILMQRVKVPPSIAQFQHTLDKTQFSQLARLLKKLAPETKAQKKDRLKDAAKGESDSKAPTVLKFGINHVTDLVEEKKAKLVVIAHDVDPIELVCWLPALCRKKDIPYCVVKSKSRLGTFVGMKTAAAVAITTVKKDDQKDLDVLCESFKAAFNDNKEVQRKWGGGIMGMKSQHVEKARQLMLEKELAKKTGLMM